MNYFLPEIPLLTNTILPIEDSDFNDLNIIPPYKDNEIAIMIVHFLRDKLLLNELKSIFQHQPGHKLYIIDQGVYDKNLDKLYTLLKNNGHEIIFAGYDAGISHCRNLAIERITEPYIFWTDNDILFFSETNLQKALNLLKKYDNLGVLGFQEWTKEKINHYEMNLTIENRCVMYIPVWTNNPTGEIIYCDMTINDCLAKKEVFKDVKWDERMKLAEHLDFFLQLKYNSYWKVAYTDIFVKHQDVIINNPDYKLLRGRNKYFWQYYIEKWNVDYLHSLEFKTNQPYKIQLFGSPTGGMEQIIEQPKKENKPDIKKKSPIELNQLENELNNLITILTDSSVSYCILETTCLEMICKNKIETLPLIINIPSYNINLQNILKNLQYICSDEIITKNNISFKIKKHPINQTKPYEYKNHNFIVPCPVIKYLERLYNKNWEELTQNDK